MKPTSNLVRRRDSLAKGCSGNPHPSQDPLALLEAQALQASDHAFAAVLGAERRVVTWGHQRYGGDSSRSENTTAIGWKGRKEGRKEGDLGKVRKVSIDPLANLFHVCVEHVTAGPLFWFQHTCPSCPNLTSL